MRVLTSVGLLVLLSTWGCAAAPQKLMIGVPSYQGTWQGNTVAEQLGWLAQQGQVGTAIWDASLSASEWRQSSVWAQLKAIKMR